MNKAEQLIACLEGEIAKRDARIVELEDERSESPIRFGRRVIADLRTELAAIKAQEPVIDRDFSKFNTPRDGRAYVADWFKNVLRRHDYRQYINDRLAGDFACTLANALCQLNAAPSPVCKTCADSGCDPAFKALVPCSGCAAAPVQQVSVPEGWQLVPVEPTGEMIAAVVREADRQESLWAYSGGAFWRVLLAAAPAPGGE